MGTVTQVPIFPILQMAANAIPCHRLALGNFSRLPFVLTGTVVLLLVGFGAYAWYDHLDADQTTVAGNVSFAGERLDGLHAGEVEDIVEDRKAEVLARTVIIDTPIGELTYPLGQLGFAYRTDQVANSIMSARHRGGFLDEFSAWAMTPMTPISVSDRVEFREASAAAVINSEPGLEFSDPQEPGMTLTDDNVLVATLGTEGLQADREDLLDQLEALDLSNNELRIETRSVPIPPSVSDEEASAVVERLNEATRGGATIIVNGHTRMMTPADLRRHLTVSVGPGTFDPVLDEAALQQSIEALYPEPVGTEVLPTFSVSGGDVSVETPGVPPEVCCDPTAAETLAPAILEGRSGPFSLRTKPETDPDQIALYDGSLVAERVSSFTTPHSCCENRVKNIQRMADIVRGYYLLPGEVLSLNDYVGPRTAEKGFLPAGAIRLGRLTPEIGGGVSQFATTIFNAAYFAGLDILEYQAHSLYFTRYPFGREATISTPAPDLVFENTTPYPILIWTSYTPTSITVSMYSTENVEADQIATRTSKRNECTYVETDRERVYDDGRRVVDTFFALYRPADGIDCNGNPIPE